MRVRSGVRAVVSLRGLFDLGWIGKMDLDWGSLFGLAGGLLCAYCVLIYLSFIYTRLVLWDTTIHSILFYFLIHNSPRIIFSSFVFIDVVVCDGVEWIGGWLTVVEY